MRNTFRHSAILLLALSILLGSFGVALTQQLCQLASIQSTTAVADQCCDKSDLPDTGKASCCEEHVAYHKLEPVSTPKEFSLQVPALAFTPPTPFVAVYQASQQTQQAVLRYTNSSPPLYGRDLLHFLQLLIV
ncbi:HYC_CC_PP family protein [Pontibacter litorisediminis]|uniref:HYC_CC_PP family protein n=1 Tax=Pontibacter litorisediminis TaxID=1846260 RepID=UPI0023EB0A01|nr:hypothetical protein [Pontibacter litorisediminis]